MCIHILSVLSLYRLMIVLNSYEATKEALIKQDTVFANRPYHKSEDIMQFHDGKLVISNRVLMITVLL